MGARKKLLQLKELSFNEIKLLLTSVALLPLIAISLKVKGYKWTHGFIANRIQDIPHNNEPEDTQFKEAQQLARIVSIASRNGAYNATCLKRSLLTWWLLARRGIETVLQIGVNNKPGDFRAHAWVEYKGKVLQDPADIGNQFSAFNSLPEK